MSNNLEKKISKEKISNEKIPKVKNIESKKISNEKFFISALNELERDRCFFELCLLFLLPFNNRIILFYFFALLYSYIIASIRLRDVIISTCSSLDVYLILILYLSTF